MRHTLMRSLDYRAQASLRWPNFLHELQLPVMSMVTWSWQGKKKKNIQYHTSSTGQSRAPLTISKCHQIKSNLTFVTTTIPLGSQFQDIFKYMVSFFPSVNSSGECMVIYIKSQKPPHVGKNSFAFSRSISTHLVLPLVEYWKQSRMKWGI